jgi:Galactose oxidase, central domain
MVFRFGGTDGQFHYNDTWAFDVATRTWKELNCIGFIPAAREGHAAALVDDVMYVFGGRGVDGKDLGDLAAFKISSASIFRMTSVFAAHFRPDQRWYMFQNMGSAPSGRSGHAMSSSGTRVFVLGGESFGLTKTEDTNVIHVLDTSWLFFPVLPSSAYHGIKSTSNTLNLIDRLDHHRVLLIPDVYVALLQSMFKILFLSL